MVETIAAAVIHTVGIVGMAIESRTKGDDEIMEDKKKIINTFAKVMKMTRKNMVSLDYYVEEGGKEFAMVTFESGGKG